MLLKDLTKEQCIEIVKIIYSDGAESGLSELTVRYQPYDWKMYEDARELWVIEFKANLFADHIHNSMVEIDSKLNCWFSYIPKTGSGGRASLPTYNQYFLQKKFREWGIYPNIVEQREGEIDKIL